MIENGYRGILAFLANCEVSKLLPEVRVSAYPPSTDTENMSMTADMLGWFT
jgi:hypothetical protein